MGKIGRVILIGILACALIAACYLVWSTGQKNQGNNPEQGVQVLKGTAKGFKGDVNATVNVKDGKIVDLTIVGLDETPDIGGAAIKVLKDEILEKGGTNGVDVITGATYTSEAVFNAIADAMGRMK